MTSAGFEPAPIKTTALTWLLRPLGQDVFKHKQWCSSAKRSLQYIIAAYNFTCSLSATFNFRFSLFTYRPCAPALLALVISAVIRSGPGWWDTPSSPPLPLPPLGLPLLRHLGP